VSKRGPRDGSATSPLGKGGLRGISNFAFLKDDWAFLFEDARESERNALVSQTVLIQGMDEKPDSLAGLQRLGH